MNEETFIDSRDEGINSYHYLTLNLYFSNATGDKVVREVRNVFYSSNIITEKVIVEQIIKGPANGKLLAVADASTLVKSVKISKNICVIDLDSKFNNIPGDGTARPETCLYAFVNAICDACNVDGVQFKIEGESDVRFRGEVNLDRVFQRDADMIETSGVTEPLAEVFLDEDGEETEQQAAQAVSDEVVSTENAADQSAAEGTAGGSTELPEAGSDGNSGIGVGVDPSLVEGKQ